MLNYQRVSCHFGSQLKLSNLCTWLGPRLPSSARRSFIATGLGHGTKQMDWTHWSNLTINVTPLVEYVVRRFASLNIYVYKYIYILYMRVVIAIYICPLSGFKKTPAKLHVNFGAAALRCLKMLLLGHRTAEFERSLASSVWTSLGSSSLQMTKKWSKKRWSNFGAHLTLLKLR